TIGFVQDLSGQFGIDTRDFTDLKQLQERFRERQMVFFEPWEIVHWRLQSKFVRSIYGYSILDAARWIWKRLQMLEDTALVYKLTRSPGRYAFYVDTGDRPPDEAMSLLKKVMKGYKKRTLLNPTTGQLEFRMNPLCLVGDTMVPLVDGRVLSITDIVGEYNSGKRLWVHSVWPKDGKLLSMPLTWAGKTRENAELVKITLDNSAEIRCTPDHCFPLKDGTKVAAADLSVGDSLIPFRRHRDRVMGVDGLDGHGEAHRVVSVEHLPEREDTYTLTVNGTHTFALDAGVFTFNSPEEDMWIPTRGGKESTRVDVLAGPDWQCLAGDTPIPLMDGTTSTIEDLSRRKDEFWLYSMNEKGEVVPGKGIRREKQRRPKFWK
ncbi:MAG: portal protein, partial [Anaerolineaceae bacterium]|nr:portal protein [Anaerolineaceae bacterium]